VPPIFARAAITLGIGPHSSCHLVCVVDICLVSMYVVQSHVVCVFAVLQACFMLCSVSEIFTGICLNADDFSPLSNLFVCPHSCG